MKTYHPLGLLITTGVLILVGLMVRRDVVNAASVTTLLTTGVESSKESASALDEFRAAPSAQVIWDAEVWQSHRSGNWEIYFRAFADEELQVTNHPGADTLPRLTVGSTKVVFVSDRDGNDEIYAANPDGTDLVRLTDNSAKDTLPDWSPDGHQIIFSAQRTGSGDLYLMNADGTGLRQITGDSAEDTYPTWSPDGTQLLWIRLYPIVRNRPQEGELWVANADGSNAHAVTGRLRTPARPRISPDGARIALDADLDQNGITDIVLLDRNGGNAFIYLPGDVGILRWMGTWGLDNSTLWVTKLTFQVLLDGTWVLDHTDVEQRCLDNRAGCGSLIPGDQTAMMPDRQSADLRAPESQVNPLPAFSRLQGFMVDWSGKEYGYSGLVGYYIEYRHADESAWHNWWHGDNLNPDIRPAEPNQAAGTWLFVPPNVGKYYFRSSGRDYAGNFEPWPTNPAGDAATTVFSWYLAGQVTDGRGLPYAQQSLTLQPAAMEPLMTNLQGNFQVHIGAPGSYTLAQEWSLTMDQDRVKNYYRLPADNLIQNGGFEEPLGSDNWQISGTAVLTQSSELVHTGNQAIQVGGGCGTSCIVTLPGSNVEGLDQQALIVDPTGVLHLFARKARSTLIHQVRSPDGRWLPYVALANGIANWSPAFAFDHAGDLHLVWSAVASPPGGVDDTLYYAQYRVGQGWTQPEALGLGSAPKLAIDAQQQLHILYRCSNGPECQLARMGYRKRNSAGTWSAAKILQTTDSLVDYTLAATGRTIKVGWVELSNRRSLDRLLVATLSSDGLLGTRQQVDSGVTPDVGFSRYQMVQLLADSQQQLHLAWSGRNEAALYYTAQRGDGQWQPIETQTLGKDTPPFLLQTALVDQQDTLHFIALRSQQYPSLHFRRTVTSDWLPLEQLSLFDDSNFQLTAVAMGGQAELYFALQNFDSVAQIKATATTTMSDRSQLQQSLLIPSTLHQPTLSFFYQLNNGGTHGSALLLSVNEGLTTTTVFSTTTATNWRLGWADLTHWQGQTITLTFQTTQAAGDPYLQATLDRIALGSWRTPLPQSSSPAAVAWGSGGTLTVTGTNFIATPQIFVGERPLSNVRMVDATTVTAALPTDLAPGRYSVWVVNPSGERMAVPTVLAVGDELYLPVVRTN